MSSVLLPWLFLLVGAVATYIWRGLGVMLSARINGDSPIMRWVAAVAYAMLAGLIIRMILLPAGSLATISPIDRLGAAAVTVVAYFVTRRSIVLGVAAGAATLILLLYLRNGA
ncbi:AzlD domain-containing protein [Dongia soli]|uniref:AzlD domain-containing protein n=1 Tax=Dongia soli TaxID=600628 RepID=A0ABU5E759_9PROT|nr:AzlD domain-containing protein [Dongia soli]MDY0882121.1 AzlD domain-containing protein [Dongia soli]